MSRFLHICSLTALLVAACHGFLFTPKETTSVSSLSALIDIMHGDFSLSSLNGVIKLLDGGTSELANIIHTSPLCMSIIKEAAEKNSQAQVLSDLIEGRTPNLGDMLNIITTSSASIGDTFDEVTANNAQFQRMDDILRHHNKNHTAMKEAVEIIAGKKIDENLISLMHEKYAIAGDKDLTLDNLLNLFYFVGDNYDQFLQSFKMLKADPVDYQGILSLITHFNFVEFPTVMAPTFTFKGKTMPSMDPEALRILHALKYKYPEIITQGTSSEASTAVYDFFDTFIKITNHLMATIQSLGQQSH